MTHFTNPFASARQGQQRQAANVHRPHPNDSARVSPQSSTKNRLPQGISFNLVSLVTKFEALDALSLPVTTPLLQPAPLQISKAHSRQKGATGSRYRRKLSTIFSPKRGSAEKHDRGLSEEELRAAQVDIVGSSNSRKLASLDKVDVRKLGKAQTSYKPSSIGSRGSARDAANTVHGRSIRTVAAPYVQNEIPEERKRGSIKDRIQFYDGAVSTGTNTRANPSVDNTAAPNTPVSLSGSRLLDRSQFLIPSTGGSKRTGLHIQDADALTPTRSNETSTSRQHFSFGASHNQTAQNSPSRSSLSNVTPQTMNSAGQYTAGPDTSPSRLPARQRLAPGSTRGRRNVMIERKAYADVEVGGDGSTPPSLVGQDQSSMNMSRRRPSDMIEERYRANNTEKKVEEGQETAEEQQIMKPLTVEAITVRELERRLTEPRPGRFSDMTRSKVAAMRKLFSPRSASPEVPCCGLDPFLDVGSTLPSQKQDQVARPPSCTPPTPPPLPPAKALDVPKASSNIEQVLEGTEDADVFNKMKTEVPLAASPMKKASLPKSKLIGERPSNTEVADVFDKMKKTQVPLAASPIKKVSPPKSKFIGERPPPPRNEGADVFDKMRKTQVPIAASPTKVSPPKSKPIGERAERPSSTEVADVFDKKKTQDSLAASPTKKVSLPKSKPIGERPFSPEVTEMFNKTKTQVTLAASPTKKVSLPKSKPIGERPFSPEVTEVFDKTKTKVTPAASPTKVSPPKSKLIGERVRIFETVPESVDEVVQPGRGKALGRRLSKSLRSLFEAPSRRSREEESEKNKLVVASASPKRAPSPDGNGEISTRGSIVGRWNKFPNAMSSGGDGTMSGKQSASPAEGDDVAEMVIKGVECGLKEPRPVRAVEIKSMALLCRDRMGEILDREKGRVSLRGKF